jgi:HD-like signal output (HDOD) protein
MENRLPDAFNAGLLVDLGCLLLFRIVTEIYPGLLNEAGRQHQVLADLELELLQLTHCEAGALALHDLGLPMQLCDAVRGHHDPRESGDVGLEAIVGAGVELANVFEAPDETADVTSDRLHQLLGEHPEALRTRIELEVEALRQAAFVWEQSCEG